MVWSSASSSSSIEDTLQKRSAGHREIASDAEKGNDSGIAAHRALGDEVVERVVCFRKTLG